MSTKLHITEFGDLLARENHRLILDTGKPLGEDATAAIISTFISSFVESVMTMALDKYRHDKSLSKELQYQKTEHSLRVYKSLVQNSTAIGYEAAMTKFSGNQDLTYFCQIKLEPKPISKMVN